MTQNAPPSTLDAPSASPRLDSGAWLVLLAAFLGWMFDGLEQAIFPLIARPALLQMMHTKNDGDIGPWNGWITAAFLVGAALGGITFGWLGDRIGRVRSMALSVLCYSAFTGLGYFAQAPIHLVVLRFLAGLGMGGEWSLGVALVMEYWPNNRRPLLAGLIGMAANVGFLSVGLLAMVFKVTEDSWRWMMLAGVSPAILTFLIRLFVPESEKWKHAVSTENPPKPIREVFSPASLPRVILAMVLASIALIGTWGAVQMCIPSWVDAIQKSELGKPDPTAKAFASMLLAMGAIVGTMTAALLAGRWGRRVTYFGLCALSLAATAYLFRFYPPHFDFGMKALIFIVGALTASFYGWMPLYLPELFATRVRATGQGIAYNSGRIFAAFGAIYSGSLVRSFNGSYAQAAGVITLIYVLGMVIIWAAPETKGKPLPD